MNTKTIEIQQGFRAFVAGIVNADFNQRAYVEITQADGGRHAVTFEGQGNRQNMHDTSDASRTSKDFGPYSQDATISVTITHLRGGVWTASKVVEPLSIEKRPYGAYPAHFYKSTIISEDGDDNSHDDCTVTVLQYKI